MKTTTGIIMATKLEAEPFISGLGLGKAEKNPAPVFMMDDIILTISGIGKTNAAIATSRLIGQYKPSRIFNLGAAGAAGQKFGIGDILHIDKIYELDRPHLISGKPTIHKPDILKGFTRASLSTQDRPVLDIEDRHAAGTYADLLDMEGAAIVQACRAFGVKAYVFKIVTDNSESGKREIIFNMLATRHALFRFFRERVMVPRQRRGNAASLPGKD